MESMAIDEGVGAGDEIGIPGAHTGREDAGMASYTADGSAGCRLPLERIAVEDRTFCHRIDLDADALALQIASEGWVEPITVRPRRGGDTYQVVAGFRRLAATRRLGWRSIPARVRPELGEEEAWRLSIAGDPRHRPFNDIERAHILARCGPSKGASFDAAALLGIGVRQKNNLRRLLTLPTSAQAAIVAVDHPFSSTHALQLLRAAGRGEAIDIEAWVERIRREQLSVSALAAALEQPGEGGGRGDVIRLRSGEPDGAMVIEFGRRRVDVGALDEHERQYLAAQARALVAALARVADGGDLGGPIDETCG